MDGHRSAPAPAIADLIGPLGNRAPDAASAQVSAIRARGVRSVSPHPQWSAPWPAHTVPGHPDRVQDGCELWAVTALPCGNQHGQRLLSLLTRQMDLRREPASRPAQPVVLGFFAHTTRRFLLQSTVPTGTRRMLMRTADRRVDTDFPKDQSGRIRPRLQQSQQPGPHAPTLPPPEQSVHRLPRPVLNRQIPPRNTGPHAPPDTVYQPSAARLPTTHTHRRQQRLQHRPLLIRKIPTQHTLIITVKARAGNQT